MSQYALPGCLDPASCDYDANATGFSFVGNGACRDADGFPLAYSDTSADNTTHCQQKCRDYRNGVECTGMEYSTSTRRCELYTAEVARTNSVGGGTACYSRDDACDGPALPNRDCTGACLGYADCANNCTESIASPGVYFWNWCGMCTAGGDGGACDDDSTTATTSSPLVYSPVDGVDPPPAEVDFWLVVGLVIGVVVLVVAVTIGLVFYFNHRTRRLQAEKQDQQRKERQWERDLEGRRRVQLGGTSAVSYTHLTLPTIYSV